MNPFLKEIFEQPKAVRDTAQWLSSETGKQALDAVYEMWTAGRNDVLFTGMGSSYFVGVSAATMLNSRGIRARALNTAELLHYQMASIGQETLLVCISQSGESYEVVALLKELDDHFPVTAISNEPCSTLARRALDCGILLECRSGEELMTSTKTFINCHQVLCALIERICNAAPIPCTAWDKIASDIQAVIDSREQWLPECRRVMGIPDFVQLIGRGPVMDSVCQSALMFMEASHTPASYLTGGDFRHGPMETVNPSFTAVVMTHSDSATYAQSSRLVDDILAFGGRVILVSDRKHSSENENLCCICVPQASSSLYPMLSVIPLQFIVDDLAERKGFTAGDFSHGHKVTAIE